MSNDTNTILFERAHEAIEYALSHPSGIDKQIIKAQEDNDLEELERLVSQVEGDMSQEHFKNYDILERGDEY